MALRPRLTTGLPFRRRGSSYLLAAGGREGLGGCILPHRCPTLGRSRHLVKCAPAPICPNPFAGRFDVVTLVTYVCFVDEGCPQRLRPTQLRCGRNSIA